MKMPSIYLSPSTQENNIGAIAEYGTEEYRMNQIGDLVMKYLKVMGYTVYRNSPIMTLKQVVEDSNKHNPDIHVAIHSNASNGKARGSLVLCHRFGGEGEKLARAISKELSVLTPTDDYGVKEGYRWLEGGKPLYETAYTGAPAVIIEVDFHDNPAGAEWILANMDALAKAIVTGINNYFGINPLDVLVSQAADMTASLDRYNELLKDIKTLIGRFQDELGPPLMI